MVRETRHGLEWAQNFAFSSTHSREGRFPANFPMTAKEKDSFLEESMDCEMVKASLLFFQVVGVVCGMVKGFRGHEKISKGRR